LKIGPPVALPLGKESPSTLLGRIALATSVLTSQTIYLLTALEVPMEFLQAIQKLIWAGTKKVFEEK
jgi:hypothetical protein